MRATQRPQYLVITFSAITLKYLNTTIKHLMSVRVFFEERHNKKRIIQCHRCQVWEYATSNCFRQPKCLKCAESHLTRTCQKPTTEKAKCANCKEDHPANATICPIYKEKLSARDNNTQPIPAKRYVDAPPPERNVWAARSNRDRGNFPPLQQHSRTQQPPTKSQPVSQPAPRSTTSRSSTTEASFQQTRNIMTRLNELINVGEANRAIEDLILHLEKVSTGKDCFDLYFSFMSDIKTKYQLV